MILCLCQDKLLSKGVLSIKSRLSKHNHIAVPKGPERGSWRGHPRGSCRRKGLYGHSRYKALGGGGEVTREKKKMWFHTPTANAIIRPLTLPSQVELHHAQPDRSVHSVLSDMVAQCVPCRMATCVPGLTPSPKERITWVVTGANLYCQCVQK